VCAHNDVGRHFTARVTQTLRRLADVTVDRLDSQRYYGATFH
jgi:flagellar motor switch protein FliM